MDDFFKNIKLLSQNKIQEKRVLVRVDFNVTLNSNGEIVDDIRIVKTIPTIELLLKNKNKIILVSHLGRPQGRDEKYSLKPVADYLQKTFSANKVILLDDFTSESSKEELSKQNNKDIVLLENIRFYKGEKTNDPNFAKELASIADVFVNDAFGVSHRNNASVTGVAKLLPSYCGLLLEEEIRAVLSATQNSKHPVVAIIGGAKISTKISFLSKLMDTSDFLLLAGGIANTLLAASGKSLGESLMEKNEFETARHILSAAKEKNVKIILPSDFYGLEKDEEKTCKLGFIPDSFSILDIGPKTQAAFGDIIKDAKTIIWNGPVGKIEDPRFKKGTDFIFDAISQNKNAYSIVGGGDTLAALPKAKYLNNITHVSTGGGAMLELIENGTLPGIEALRKN